MNKKKRLRLIALIFSLIMVTSLGAPLGGATTGAQEDGTVVEDLDDLTEAQQDVLSTTVDENPPGDHDTTVSEEVEESNEKIEIIVRFDEIEPIAVASSEDPVTVLESHSELTQNAVVDFADQREGIEVVNQFWLANAALVEIDADSVDIDELAAQDGVDEIHENFEVTAPEPESFEASVTDEEVTYGLDQINTTEVWDEFDTRGEGATIAVLDTGVDIDHPDIDLYTENPNDDTYPGGWAEFDGGGDKVPGSEPYDTGFHGTHVAGTVAGGNDSGTAIGVAPEANMMHGLVLPGGSGGFAQIIGGMEWAVEEDADVVSMSLGADGHHPELIEPVRNAEDAGTLVIGAAGNSGPGVTGSPGNVYDTLAVGASDEDGEIAPFSGGETIDTDEAWGDEAPEDWPEEYTVPDVSAPGVAVLSAVPEGSVDEDPDAIYGMADGTSMATPHVSGAAALMLSASGGQLTPDEITDALEVNSWTPDDDHDGPDTRYGHGIIDAMAATETSAVDSGANGTVTDVDGDPIEEATVSFDGFPVSTDSDGYYEVNLAPGEYDVEASAFAHQTNDTTITVEEDEFVATDFSLNFAVESILVEDQPLGISDGDSFDVVAYAENLEEYEVSATGDYDEDDLTVLLDGDEIAFDEPETFDEPLSDEITLTVETTEETSGDVGLEHSFSGFGETQTISTGPTGVFDETVEVAVVDDSSSTLGDSLQTQLQQTAPWFDVEGVDDDELEDAVTNDDYDVYVVQDFGGADVEWFLDETESPETGVVLLDQFADESNAINDYVDERENPNAVVNATGSTQQPIVAYEIEEDHPFYDGVGEEGDVVDLYTSGAVLVESGYHATMEGFSSGEYGKVATSNTAITGTFGTAATGTGLAEDQFTRTVWAPSLGQGSYAAVGDSFEPEAYEILTNVVEYANDEPVITPTSPQDVQMSPGEETTVTVDTPNLETYTVELGDESTLSEEEVTLYVNDDEVESGDELEPDADDLEITAEVDDDVTGKIALDHIVVTTDGDESVETTFNTGPTSVYEAPLEVPEDVSSIQDALDLAVDDEEIIVDNGTYEEAPESAPTDFGPALWIENDGIELRVADDAEATILYGGDDTIVQNGLYVTGDDVTIDGFDINLEDGEAVEGGMHSIVTAEYEGTQTTGLTVTDVTHAGARGVMLEDGVSDVVIDGTTAVDSSGIAGSYTVVVADGTSEDEVEDSTVFDPELHDLEGFDDVDFEELEQYGLDFNDIDLDRVDVDEIDPDNLTVDALMDEDLEQLDQEVIAESEGMESSDDGILPNPDPTPATENIEITNAVMEEPSSDNAHGMVLRDVQNVSVTDTDVANDELRRALFFQSSSEQRTTGVGEVSQDIEISNVDAAARASSDSAIRFMSAGGTIEDTNIEHGTIGVRQEGTSQVPLDVIEPTIEVHNSSIDVNEQGLYVKHDTDFDATLNDIDAETGIELYGEIDPNDVVFRYNDISAVDTAAVLDGETTDGSAVDARLNYLGSAAPAVEGAVEVSPALPEAVDEVPDVGDIDAPTIRLDMEAGGQYAVGVPGPTSATVEDVFEDTNAVVYGFDADNQSWTQLTGDDSLATLQGLMVVPEEDAAINLEFDSGDGPAAPGQTDVTEGWNFVTAPFYGEAGEVFDYSTAEVSLFAHTYDRPVGQLAGTGEVDGTLTQHDTANVSPFEGYFTFAEEDGTLPAHLTADPDLYQLYEQLQADADTEPPAQLHVQGILPEETTVEHGDELSVSALIANSGSEELTQTVEVQIDGEAHEAAFVTVEGGETKTVEFDPIDTANLEPGEFTHSVVTEDSEMSGTLTVEEELEEAEYAVTDLDPISATVLEGEEIDVSAAVTNTGDESATQIVELRVDGDELASSSVSLEGGETETVEFTDIDTSVLGPGTYSHGIYSDDDDATGTLTIEEAGDPSEFEVSDLEPESATVEIGDSIDVSATVTNGDDEFAEDTVELRIDDDEVANATVSLDGGDSETVEFTDIETDDLEAGDYEHGVYAPDDEATGTLTVEEPPEPATFEVDDLEPEDETVTVGDEITVSANVTNTGEESGEDTVELEIGDDEIENDSVNLDAGDSTEVTFEDVDTGELEPDEYTHSVSTSDDEVSGTLTVLTDQEVVLTVDPDAEGFESDHTWDVTHVDLDGEELDQLIVDYSDTGTVLDVAAQDAEVTITNEDGEDQTVGLGADDSDEDDMLDHSTQFTSGVPDGPASFTAPGTTNPEEAGEYDAEITFVGDGGTEETFETTFEIDEVDPAEFDVAEVDAPAEVDEDEPFDVDSTIENVGDLEDTQTVEYRIVEEDESIDDAEATFEEEVTLDLGEDETVVFDDIVAADEELEPGSYEHGVFTDNDSVTEDIDIESVSGLSVSELDFEAPVETVANQPFEVSTTITNFDDETVTDDVDLRLGEDEDSLETLESEEVTLDAGDSTEVVFEEVIVEDEADEGDYIHGLFTETTDYTADIEVYPAAEVELDVDPAEDDTTADHHWEIDAVDFGSDYLDEVNLDYSGTGANFSDTSNSDVTVEVTETGDDDPTTYEPGAASEYDEEQAELRFGLFDNPETTDVASVTVEDVDNPPEEGSFEATLEMVTNSGTTLTYTAEFELDETGETTVSELDASGSSPVIAAGGA